MEFLPKNLIEKINSFKQNRQIYLSAYPAYEATLIEKRKLEKQKSRSKRQIKSETFFTMQKLEEIGLQIGLRGLGVLPE